MDKKISYLPAEFLQKLQILYPAEFHNICRTFMADKQTTFRPNFVKIEWRPLLELLEKERIRTKRLHWVEHALVLDFPTQREFEKTSMYQNGFVYVQNISSMLPVLVLDPQPGESILDLCAAPGGKTTQIVSQTRGKANVVAVELETPRYCKLEANIKIQGQHDYITLIHGDGVAYTKEHYNQFDRVLVDAPCTSESGFDVHHPRSYSYWSPKAVKICQTKQRHLLTAGIYAAKENAIIIYSTCTFSPEENEEVVQAVLNKFPGQIALQEISINIPNSRPGIGTWNGQKFSKEMCLVRRVLPNEHLEAFFIAKFKKISTTLSESVSK